MRGAAVKYEIRSVVFDEDGMVVSYLTSDDIRVGGKLMATHQLHLHVTHPDYADDREGLHDKVERILRSALEDFTESDPWEPEEEDEESELGMGWANEVRGA
jgi:hypothetical protein